MPSLFCLRVYTCTHLTEKWNFSFLLLTPCLCPPLLIKWWNISWKHNPLKSLRWLFLKEWKVLIQRSHELTEGCGDGEYQMEASPTSSPAPSSSSFSSSSSKLKYRLNCRGKEDLFLFKPIGPVPLLCRITLLIRSLPSVLLLKPSVFGTAPKDTVLRRGFTGAARQTTGILKAQSKLTAHRVERTINRARSSSLLATMTELQADDSSSVAGKPVADLACSFLLLHKLLHFARPSSPLCTHNYILSLLPKSSGKNCKEVDKAPRPSISNDV